MHDKKSDHYTSPDNYKDLDGNMRTFNYVDYDPKTRVATSLNPDKETLAKLVAADRKALQQKILDLDPSAVPHIFHDFTLRGEQGISWRKPMILDEGTPTDKLRDLHTLTEKRQHGTY